MARPRTLFLTAAAISALVTTVIAQPPPRPLPQSVTQAGFSQPASIPQTRSGRDLTRLPPLAQQLYLSGQRGSEWLYRMHQPTGRFVPGWNPALNQPDESDSFLHQVGAAAALAQAGRFYRSESYAVRSSQALLTLLAETGPDPRDPTSRATTLPSSVVNKLSSAGLLLMAIAEMPAPPPDLLEQGEQLARFIVRQQRPDGAFVATDLPADTADFESVQLAPGLALTGLMRSHSLRPGAWKLDAARRALAYYRPWWREHRQTTFAMTMTPAFADAFLLTKDRARDIGFAEFTCEMADWLCTQQFDKLDARRPLWCGGFPDSAGSPPTIATAGCAGALIDAARVTRQLPDAERFGRYRDAATLALQFTSVLQFTEANTQHFASNYREQFLLGGFRTSPTDATLRLDGTQQAVTAIISFLVRILEVA